MVLRQCLETERLQHWRIFFALLFGVKGEIPISKNVENVIISTYIRVNTSFRDFNTTAQFDSNRF